MEIYMTFTLDHKQACQKNEDHNGVELGVPTFRDYDINSLGCEDKAIHFIASITPLDPLN